MLALLLAIDIALFFQLKSLRQMVEETNDKKNM